MRDREKEFIDFYKQRLLLFYRDRRRTLLIFISNDFFAFYRDRRRAFLYQMNHFLFITEFRSCKILLLLTFLALQGIFCTF